MSEPRILHFSTRWLRGGMEMKTLAELRGLRQRYRFAVVHGAESEPEMVDRVRELDIPCVALESLRHLRPWTLPKAARRFRELVVDTDPDIVHVHSTEAGICGRWGLRDLDVPVVYTLHGLPFGPQRSWPVRVLVRAIERRLARHTDRFVANADAIRDAYLRAGIGRPDRYVTIYSGVDLGRMATAEPVEVPGEAPRVLFAGRLAKGKGVRRTVEAVRRLRDRGTRASLLVAGVGPLAERLPDVPWLHRLGFRDDLPGVMKSCDVLALPSDHEGTPRVVTEAMACGLPVVASEVGGIPEQIADGESGFLVQPGDVADLTDALEGVLTRPKLAERMSEAGKKRAGRFSETALVEATDRLYREIRASRRSRTGLPTA